MMSALDLALKIINVILVVEILFLFCALLYLKYKTQKKRMEAEKWLQELSEKNKENRDREK